MGLTRTVPRVTELERLWNAWQAKEPGAQEAFFEELIITCIPRGPSHLPVDEK
jgi:hypothetical protein